MRADIIKVNHLLEIEMENNIGKEYLPSRLEEISDEHWHISMPMRKGMYITMRVGQKIRIVLRYRNTMFAATTVIAARRRGHIPVLIVSKPKDLIAINQKRTYVRISVAIPVAFRLLLADGEKGELLQGVTGDISAGGMLLLSPQDMEKDQKIEVEIKLPDSDSIFCQAHVVRVLGKASEEGSNNKYAIEYDDINEGQRDRIFRFIFDKQREWLRKGVTE
ncbi:flagellar brake protein [Syntrophomonas wolfei]|uniref:Glycosyltransferase-like protein n=1 Tax=Syntrophomonas wolfei subsp. wolfei (strain DSM 2245B / Goettingen) TaxID=335541 RepID=Q0AYL4_SYNWW|nr:flagellar brake domain-containing protein [Syntrophomonas wolfei]ABI68190.1 glycosyltransferase-like protein [Syntrophomonas wolfei subsp. wolfei str. Goettingen G311]